MAIFLGDSGVGAPRGTVGGVSFRLRRAYGVASSPRVRRRSSPNVPQSVITNNARARSAWVSLSVAERDSWFAMQAEYQTAFGQGVPSSVSAFGLFTRCFTAQIGAGIVAPLTFATVQLQNRRQGVPHVFSVPDSDEVQMSWVHDLSGDWAGTFSWLKARVTRVDPPGRKRPARSWHRTFHIRAIDIPISLEFFDPLVVPHVFERDEGWFRWEFQSWDQFGWFSTPRSLVFPVCPSSVVCAQAAGSNTQTFRNSFIEYDPPLLSIQRSSFFTNDPLVRTVGKGGLETIGEVMEFVSFLGSHDVVPHAIFGNGDDPTGLRPIPRVRTNRRYSPVPFVFDPV